MWKLNPASGGAIDLLHDLPVTKLSALREKNNEKGSQVVVVEGVSDQFYLSAIKSALVRDQKYAPQRELVFAPAGGAKGVQGISSLISSVSDDLPMVVLDSDNAGLDFKSKLENGLYRDCKGRIVAVKQITGIEQSEIEDLIPYSFISKTVEKLLGVQDEDDEFEPEEGKPILPQIESFAKSRGIELKPGWKVILSKAFKRTLLGKKQRTIPEKYMKMWVDLFEKIT